MHLPRLILVTGKGGTGKSTCAAALALALSRRRPTSLADLNRDFAAPRIFEIMPPSDHKPLAIAENLEAVALSPRAELEAFIHRIVPLKAISRRMLGSRTFGYVTAALPGLEAFLMLERLRMMAGQAALEDRYVVVDAPASGGAIELLSVAGGVRELAAVGALNRLAAEVESFLSDEHLFGVLLTAAPEMLAILEAIETASVMTTRLHVNVLGAILNPAIEPLFESEELEASGTLGAHRRLAHRRAHLGRETERARAKLSAAKLKCIELPMVFAPQIGPVEIARLADRFERQGIHA